MAPSCSIGVDSSTITSSAGSGWPIGGGVWNQAAGRMSVAIAGSSASRALPIKRTRPSGISAAWIGVAYQPSEVRQVTSLLQPSGAEPWAADGAASRPAARNTASRRRAPPRVGGEGRMARQSTRPSSCSESSQNDAAGRRRGCAAGAPRENGRPMSEPPETIETTRTDPEEILRRLRASVRREEPGEETAAGGDENRLNRYEVVDEIARGGMGVILKVRDSEMRRSLAMKVLRESSIAEARSADSSLESQRTARFLEEAQVTGQLDHPGIVPVHEVGLDQEGQLYFTMRLVRGSTLEEVFDAVHDPANDEWSLTRALGVMLRVCEAMAFAHDRGVLHRDLKPANVMVGRFGETYVMDWGLAKIIGQADTKDIRLTKEPQQTLLTSTRKDESGREGDSPLVTLDGDVIGTPAYMAPEQALGRVAEVNQAADVYSVGSMLYHLLSGQAPYVKKGADVPALAVLQWLMEGPPQPIEELAPDLPGELVAICEKAMAREADARYASMLALGRDLQAFLEGRVVGAYETGAVAEFRKWVGRNRGLAASIAAAVLLAFVGLVAVSLVQTRARGELTAKNDELNATNAALETARAAAEANEGLARASEREARWQSYAANIAAASSSLDLGAARDAEARLAACDAELRGWEWDFLNNRVDVSLQTLEGSPESFVYAVAYSPDGTTFASAGGGFGDIGGSDNRVRIWNADGTLRHVLEGHTNFVATLAYSPSGTELATGSFDQTVRIWDVASGEQVAIRGRTGSQVAYHPDGLRLLIGSENNRIEIWNILDDSVDSGNSNQPVRGAAIAPDGELFAIGARDGTVGVLRYPEDGVMSDDMIDQVIKMPGGGARAGQDLWSGVNTLAFSEDSSELLIAFGNGTAVVWDLTAREMRLLLGGHDRAVTAAAYTPDGRNIVTSSTDGTVRFWDAGDRRPARGDVRPRRGGVRPGGQPDRRPAGDRVAGPDGPRVGRPAGLERLDHEGLGGELLRRVPPGLRPWRRTPGLAGGRAAGARQRRGHRRGAVHPAAAGAARVGPGLLGRRHATGHRQHERPHPDLGRGDRRVARGRRDAAADDRLGHLQPGHRAGRLPLDRSRPERDDPGAHAHRRGPARVALRRAARRARVLARRHPGGSLLRGRKGRAVRRGQRRAGRRHAAAQQGQHALVLAGRRDDRRDRVRGTRRPVVLDTCRPASFGRYAGTATPRTCPTDPRASAS